MEYRYLGRSGLKVSTVTLGTMTFGGKGPFAAIGDVGVKDARSIIDLCVDHGVNLIDTANMIARGDFNGAVLSAPAELQPALTDFGRESFSVAFSVLLGIVTVLSIIAIAVSALMIRARDLLAGPEAQVAPGE